MPTKIYTAQQMRDVAKCYFCSEVPIGFDKRDIAAMLRQAADAEEENIKLKEQNERYERQPEALSLLKAQEAEITKLRECLKEAVDEFCANCTASADDRRELCDQCVTCDWKEALATIRGEGGAI